MNWQFLCCALHSKSSFGPAQTVLHRLYHVAGQFLLHSGKALAHAHVSKSLPIMASRCPSVGSSTWCMGVGRVTQIELPPPTPASRGGGGYKKIQILSTGFCSPHVNRLYSFPLLYRPVQKKKSIFVRKEKEKEKESAVTVMMTRGEAVEQTRKASRLQCVLAQFFKTPAISQRYV